MNFIKWLFKEKIKPVYCGPVIIPNCKTCEWSKSPENNNWFFACQAQGCKWTRKVYNNRLCKQLYKEKN